MHRRPLIALVFLGVLAAACSSDGGDGMAPPEGGGGDSVNAFMATTDLFAGSPQRVGLGLVAGDGRLVSFGSVDFRFSYVGTAQDPSEPRMGPSSTAVYLPTPGTSNEGTRATVTQPSEARGIYEAEGVSFDQPGFWQVDVAADVDGFGAVRASTTFPVLPDPNLPAPGDPAPQTQNLTLDSKDAPAGAIDSRAVAGGEIPDRELHRWTIAEAIRQHRPALVLFSTPVFCQSQFCGPITDVVQDLAGRYEDRAVFIHVEIWQDFEEQSVTEAAAEWLFRDGDLTEPWLYLIDGNGIVQDRWGPLFRSEEIAAALEALPPMKA